MIAWFARNDVAANLLMLSIIALGLVFLSKTPLEVFPSFEADIVTVNISLRGGTPEDVEKGVTILVEEAVEDLEGIEKISSRSVEGASSVTIEIDDGYDARDLLADIKNRVDAINNFPVEAEKPVTSLAQFNREVITVSVSGNLSDVEIRELADHVRDDLLRLPSVTQVKHDAKQIYEISVEVTQDRLREYGLTLRDIGNAIAEGSIDLSAGNIRSESGNVLIRSTGQAYRRDEFERLVIKTNPDGSLLRLGDIATVNDGFEEDVARVRFNGKPASLIEVYRVGDQDAISVAKEIRDYIDAQQTLLPKGVELTYWDDDSQIVKKRLGTLLSSALQGSILVIALLSLFLRPGIAFWVFIGIPISFIGAFMVIHTLGVTINIVSLFGFIVVLGIVVDDAIVTGENVYNHMRRAESSLEASIKGTQEVAIPVTFGILTTIVAFLPLAFMEGGRGKIFATIPAVIIPILIFSLIESKLVLPAHLKHIRLRQQNNHENKFERWQRKFADNFENFVFKYYRPALKYCIRHRYTTLAFFSGTFILIVAMLLAGWNHYIFFPRIESETARVNLSMPAGTTFDITDRHIQTITDAAKQLRERHIDPETGESIISNILSITGGSEGGPNAGRVRMEVISPEDRSLDIKVSELVAEWRDIIGPIPGAERLLFRAEIGRHGDPIDVQVSANNLKNLQEISAKVQQKLAEYPTVFDIEDSLADGKQELQVTLTQQGHALGLTRADVIQQLRQSFFGLEAQRILRGRDDIRVMVRLPLDERQSIAQLRAVMITTPGGNRVPLAHVATLTPGISPSAIYRIDRFRTVNIRADVEKDKTNLPLLYQELRRFMDDLVGQYPGTQYKLEGEAREQEETFSSLAINTIMVIFAIYCLLAIPFRSYSQPIAVMSIIPFGTIGAFLGHWFMDMPITLMSILGMLALTGVLVNDSLVLVDYTNKQRAKGKGLYRAVLTAGPARFRPVLLTSLTTFFGLLPLLFEKSTQAQFLIPMAISLGFGILFTTVITLIMVPANYIILEDIKAALRLKSRNEHLGSRLN